MEGHEPKDPHDRIAAAAAHTASLHEKLAGARSRLVAIDAETLASQIAVTEIPAPTDDEAERGAWVARRFEALRLDDVHTDGAGNVIGTRAGRQQSPPVVVLAHLDTVFARDAIGPAHISGTRIVAPGIGDNGRGLAALLALAGAIDGSAITTERPVCFVATTGEEGHGDLRGVKHFFAERGAACAAIAIDSPGDERIVHRAVGSRRLRITITGPGGHSWTDFGVANPLHAAANAIAALTAHQLPRDPYTTLTVARAGGGLSINSIPPEAWFEVDIRSTADAPVRSVEAALHTIITHAVESANRNRKPQTPSLTSRVSVIGTRPAGELAAASPLVEIAMTATRLVGRAPQLATGSTDANVPLSLGIPAIAIGGGGSGGGAHTTAEWYDNADGVRGLARALTIVVAAAS